MWIGDAAYNETVSNMLRVFPVSAAAGLVVDLNGERMVVNGFYNGHYDFREVTDMR